MDHPLDEIGNGHLGSIQTLDTDSRSSVESSTEHINESTTNVRNIAKSQTDKNNHGRNQSIFPKNELLTDEELSDFSDTEEEDEEDDFRHRIVLNGNQTDGKKKKTFQIVLGSF